MPMISPCKATSVLARQHAALRPRTAGPEIASEPTAAARIQPVGTSRRPLPAGPDKGPKNIAAAG
eukprot:scaffold7597_cov132-Isochrysis_galbana.AAC.1